MLKLLREFCHRVTCKALIRIAGGRERYCRIRSHQRILRLSVFTIAHDREYGNSAGHCLCNDEPERLISGEESVGVHGRIDLGHIFLRTQEVNSRADVQSGALGFKLPTLWACPANYRVPAAPH